MCSIDSLWEEVEIPLKIVQTAAVLEVFHAMFGLVKSPWVVALIQGGLHRLDVIKNIFNSFLLSSIHKSLGTMGSYGYCSNCAK